ncbi:MAG: hypothetical protein WCK59_03095 [Candidatus Falkowbacteria bacterium]
MKNPIKQYFLLLSHGPFVFSITVFFIVIFVLLALGEDKMNELITMKRFFVFLAILISHMVLVYTVRDKYITTADGYNSWSDNLMTLFCVLVTAEGERIVLTKPIWKQGKKYFIIIEKRLSHLDYDELSHNKLVGHVGSSNYVQGKYKNSLVRVPVTVTLNFDGEFDKLKIFNSLLKTLLKSEQKTEILDIDEYLQKIFLATNQIRQPEIDLLICKYAQLKISDAEFLSELLEILTFPERLLSCVTDTKICLDRPITSACKGMMCESAIA